MIVERSSYLVQVLWESLEEQTDFVDSGRFVRRWASIDPFLAGPLLQWL